MEFFYTGDPLYMRGICYGPMSVCVCLSLAHFLSKQLDRLELVLAYWLSCVTKEFGVC